MDFFTKLIKSQVALATKLNSVCSVENSRNMQDKLGMLMSHKYREDVIYKQVESIDFSAEFVIPKRTDMSGVILYLHGGGYVSGKMSYARGFATILAAFNHIKVLCVEYRLAPENKFPAALDDAYEVYGYLLSEGYSPNDIVLCGESAGGGLVYSLALKIKENAMPMPTGIISISPWTDLTSSGDSYKYNRKNDPSMTKERLAFFAGCYTNDIKNKFVSPIFGDLDGLPPSIIFAGGAEIMLSDALDIHKKLLACGCKSQIHVAPEMWHIYVLFNLKEFSEDYVNINIFLKEVLDNG
ncbi:MAG: alpha/beta hydrolase [Ruminococcus flavefaciens]|nr:alpha/beta hydrolase [Ruminococcus flavefaciens]MCM1060236.1 alpha/beta hydrolase [Eubacterium sp.]